MPQQARPQRRAADAPVTDEPVCLRITFTLQGPIDGYVAHCRDLASSLREVAGLRFKLWLLDREARSAGGVYLFADRASAEAYLQSATISALRSSAMTSDVRAEWMPLCGELSALTCSLLAPLPMSPPARVCLPSA